jgi:hypothetical protein
MGWLEFKAWVRELNRQRKARTTSPDSWEGRDEDQFWVEQDRLRARLAGRA